MKSDQRTPPVVSVIVPAYNRAWCVGRAISSVLSQSWCDLEVLVVDDGSTDRTAGVIDSVDDARVIRISHGRRRGASAARNTGIHAARGEFVAFLDSDDLWFNEKLTRQIQYLEGHPGVGAVACGGYRVRNGGRERVVPRIFGRNLMVADTMRSRAMAGTTLLVGTGFLREIGGFDERLESMQDVDLLLRLSDHIRIGTLRDPLVQVNAGAEWTRIGNSPRLRLRGLETFSQKHADLLGDPESRCVVSTRRAHCLWELGDRLKSLRTLARAFRASPTNLDPWKCALWIALPPRLWSALRRVRARFAAYLQGPRTLPRLVWFSRAEA